MCNPKLELEELNNTLYRQSRKPTYGQVGDLWLDTEDEQYIIYLFDGHHWTPIHMVG